MQTCWVMGCAVKGWAAAAVNAWRKTEGAGARGARPAHFLSLYLLCRWKGQATAALASWVSMKLQRTPLKQELGVCSVAGETAPNELVEGPRQQPGSNPRLPHAKQAAALR